MTRPPLDLDAAIGCAIAVALGAMLWAGGAAILWVFGVLTP